MKPKYRFGDQDFDVSPVRRGNPSVLNINGSLATVYHDEASGYLQKLTINGRTFEAHVARDGDDIFVQLNGEHWHFQAINPIDAAGDSSNSGDIVSAPMPGVVVSLNVEVGERVSEGTTILTIESMKLQTAIIAERDGQVAELYFLEGDTFDKGADLLRFEAPSEDTPN